MTRVAVVGECMVELRRSGDSATLTQGFSGDTYNAAVYLKRAAPTLEVLYVSALGDDSISAAMRRAWAAEGIDGGWTPSIGGALPGLYLIETDADGERRFHYWRSAAAARRLFDVPDGRRLVDRAAQIDLLYLSGISLAILPPEGRERLLALAAAVRSAGGGVAFDSNHRPALWHDAREDRTWVERASRLATIALPSLDDEAALFGERDPAAIDRRLARWGVDERVIKDGANGAWVGLGGSPPIAVPAVTPAAVIDTTAAGDSFNGAYLAARLTGASPVAAARAGAALAARVIAAPGAILPREKAPAPR